MNAASPIRIPALASRLATWRAGRAGGEHHLDDASSRLLFGVGLATLQRIERGEVEPEPEIEERIRRMVDPQSHSSASAPAADVSPGRSRPGAQGVGGAAKDAPPTPNAWRSAQPDGPGFARRPGGIRMFHGGMPHDFTVGEALAMRAGLDRALEGETR